MFLGLTQFLRVPSVACLWICNSVSQPFPLLSLTISQCLWLWFVSSTPSLHSVFESLSFVSFSTIRFLFPLSLPSLVKRSKWSPQTSLLSGHSPVLFLFTQLEVIACSQTINTPICHRPRLSCSAALASNYLHFWVMVVSFVLLRSMLQEYFHFHPLGQCQWDLMLLP